MEKYFAGRNPSWASLCRHLADTAVVCVTDVLVRLASLPRVLMPDGPVPANLVHGAHAIDVILWRPVRLLRSLHEEGVVGVSRRVHLGLDQGVEIPKPDSTKLLVGISAKPSCRKVSRNCWRTLRRGGRDRPRAERRRRARGCRP